MNSAKLPREVSSAHAVKGASPPRLPSEIGRADTSICASDLVQAERTFLRDRLRSARYSALADSEGFHEVCHAVEALGMRLHGAESTLYGYWPSLRDLAVHSPIFGTLPTQFPAFFTRFDALYETLRRARNDAMHSGSYARHATAAAVELCIGLEEALMNAADAKLTVADYMVKSPVTIEPWQPVAYARQLMLAHSFSYLPMYHTGKWKLLSELAVVGYLHPMTRLQKDAALAQPVADAVSAGLKLLPAKTVKATDSVSALVAASAARPTPTLWLVVESKKRLTGVLSPFELM